MQNTPAQNNNLIILSVDPGYDRLGVAILKESVEQRGKPTLLFSDCVLIDKKYAHSKRIEMVGQEIAKLIAAWQPTEAAIEELFFSNNQKTAVLVSQALGVIMYESSKSGADIFYYKPVEVKVAVTGYGKSDKTHIIDMVPRLIAMEPKKRHDDEYDAVAIGLTHLACRRVPRKRV